MQGCEKEYLKGTVNAETGGELALGSSKITVPPSAFVDENGKPISGEVTLKYREFNDVLDIFLSGIPMEYDSAGVNYTFESNGMFELRGVQENKALFVAEGKDLEVKMAIDEIKQGFSEYVLDESTGEWLFKNGQNYEVERVEEELLVKTEAAQDNPVPLAEDLLWGINQIEDVDFSSAMSLETVIKELIDNEPEVKAIKKKIKEIVKEKKSKKSPTKPTVANPELPQIQIEVDYADFPELKAFKNTLFQVAESDLDDLTWSGVRKHGQIWD